MQKLRGWAALEWKEVEKLLESARHSGVTAKGHVLEGPPFQAVIRKVLVDGYGLVVSKPRGFVSPVSVQ